MTTALKHLSIGQPSTRVWCSSWSFPWSDIVASAAKTTCADCLREYIAKAWAPSPATAPVCRPANDHCDQPVAHEGDQCAGHAHAAAQYAAE